MSDMTSVRAKTSNMLQFLSFLYEAMILQSIYYIDESVPLCCNGSDKACSACKAWSLSTTTTCIDIFPLLHENQRAHIRVGLRFIFVKKINGKVFVVYHQPMHGREKVPSEPDECQVDTSLPCVCAHTVKVSPCPNVCRV
jgi:hypothetical protein